MTPSTPRRVAVVAGLLLGFAPMLPARAATAGPAVYAAEAEAWAYSIEVGIPGPVGPLASHTTAAIDNSPHATAASGLADPGYLIRATAGLVAGVPTPAYCESAWPEGPTHADCGASAVSDGAGQSTTDSGDGPSATASAALGQVTPSDAAGALTIAAQSTTSSALLDKDGAVKARADVTLKGVNIAGGAVHIGALAVHRDATASGGAKPTTTTAIELSDVTVAGNKVASAADQVKAVTDAVQKAFGNSLTMEAFAGRETADDAGQLAADTTGLRITLQPDPTHSVQIVLGYGRVLVYGADGDAPAATADGGAPPDASPAVLGEDLAAPSAEPAGRSAAMPVANGAPATVPFRSPTRAAFATPSTAVRWVSPFLVLAQMTSGGQTWWFLLGLLPLLAAGWLTRRAGMGVLAPWAAPGRSS